MRTWKDETIKRELNRLAEGLQEVDKTIISYVRISMGNFSNTRTVTVYTDFAKNEWLFKATFDFDVNTMTLECRGVEPCTNRISSLKSSVNACIETFNCTFDEFEYYYGVPYKHYLSTTEAEEIAEQSVQQEGRTLTVTLHPEDEEEEITITYEDAKGFHYVVGQEALEIEKSTDGISIDKDHVYIVIEFLDGSEATFRRSSVVRIAEEGHVLLERDPEPTPEEADREVTYIDFKPEQDYEEERPPHAAFEQLRRDSIEPPKIWSCKALKVQEILQKIYEGKTKTSGERLDAYYNHCNNLILASRIFLPECMYRYLERKLSNELVIAGVCPAVIEEAFGYKKTRRKWYWKL